MLEKSRVAEQVLVPEGLGSMAFKIDFDFLIM
jgi:hypothetical protein